MINGILNVYKEKDYTSFDVVARLRGILGQKRIGHTGTLDPMAEGVLIVCLGTATKLVDMLTAEDKRYRTVMRLGISTDTEDITGRILSTGNLDYITPERVTDTLLDFVGEYSQIPPMYSAIRKNGRKLYEYAREGIEIDREPRVVSIYSIDDITIALPCVSFLVHCSKGTYIRSLCRDVGDRLGCGAVMDGLIREEVHGYRSDTALRLDEIADLAQKNMLAEHIISVDTLLSNYPAYRVTADSENALKNGNKLRADTLLFVDGDSDCNIIRVYCRDRFMALYEYISDENIYKPYKMFL